MPDRLSAILSDFIDWLPESPREAAQILESRPFAGKGELPGLAELAVMIRAVPQPQPRLDWLAATRRRLISAAMTSPEGEDGLIWLGSLFLPLKRLALPWSLMPMRSALLAACMVSTLLSPLACHGRARPRSPFMQLVDQSTSCQRPASIAAGTCFRPNITDR